MGTLSIFRTLLLTGAIIESLSSSKQLFKATAIGVPALSVVSQPNRRFNTTKRNAWLSQNHPTQSPYATTISSASNTGPYRHRLSVPHDSPKYYEYFKSGPNFPVINHDSSNNRNVKYADSNQQFSPTRIPNFQYPRMQSAASAVSQNVLPTFSPSLEAHLGKFKPFPPFKYSMGNFRFSDVNKESPNDAVASSSFDRPGSSNAKINYALLNENFMSRPFDPFGYSNSFNKNEFGPGNGRYQPLSGQPQLQFYPSQQLTPDGQIVNQDSSQSSGRGGVKNSYMGGNFGTPLTSFANGDSFEVPDSYIFNEYDKAFGKYSAGYPPGSEKGNEDDENAAVTHRTDEEADGNDEKSNEYRSEESVSGSREHYKDEEDGESHNKERRGINSKKKEEEHAKAPYPSRDSAEGCGKNGFSPRENYSHESTKSHQKPSQPGKTSFGHKVHRRRPSKSTSHESGGEATPRKHGSSHKSKDFQNQHNRKISAANHNNRPQ